MVHSDNPKKTLMGLRNARLHVTFCHIGTVTALPAEATPRLRCRKQDADSLHAAPVRRLGQRQQIPLAVILQSLGAQRWQEAVALLHKGGDAAVVGAVAVAARRVWLRPVVNLDSHERPLWRPRICIVKREEDEKRIARRGADRAVCRAGPSPVNPDATYLILAVAAPAGAGRQCS